MGRPFIPAPNCARVEMIYLSGGVTQMNVLNFQHVLPYTPVTLTDLRNVVNSWDAATWQGSRSSQATLQRIKVTALDTASSPFEDYALPVPRPGIVGGVVNPGNVTFALKLATGLTGRSQRGRLYVVGMSQASLAANTNQVQPVFANFWRVSLNTLITNAFTAGHVLGVLSYMSLGAWRGTAQFTPATGFVDINLNVDSQRRRLTGRGI